MTTLAQVKADQLSARKAKNTIQATLLTTLIGEVQGALMRLDTDKRAQKEDEQVMDTIKSFVKKNREAQSQVKDVTVLDTLKQEEAILVAYMPKQLSADEMREIIRTNFQVQDLTQKSKGQVMGYLNKNYAGQVDGKLASEVFAEFI